MIPNFSFLCKKPLDVSYLEVQQGIRMLRRLDNAQGENNPKPNAISFNCPSGQLDAVVLCNPDGSETAVQRLQKKNGETQVSWLEIPAPIRNQPGGVIQKFPNTTGFEILSSDSGLWGSTLETRERAWGTHSPYADPNRVYEQSSMPKTVAELALLRAESVLVGFGFPASGGSASTKRGERP